MPGDALLAQLDAIAASDHARVESRLIKGEVYCQQCHDFWPCPAVRFAAALKAVLELHTIEKRWQPSPDCDYSYDTAEEAQDDMYDGAEPTFFEICSHCGDIEFRQVGDSGSYLEALWPCATVRVIAEQMEGR